MKNALALALLAAALFAGACAGTSVPPRHATTQIDSAVLHPIFATWFFTNEHPAGQYEEVGDALGADCFVAAMVEEEGRSWLRTYRGDGRRNEDWYAWQSEVLSPLSGEVVRLNVNPVTNEPGVMTPGMATFVILRGNDGLHVMVAHLREVRVELGERVQAGQVLGLVGNNGYSRHPHIHLGAWRDQTPLQIRFDLRAMAALRESMRAVDRGL